MERVGSVAAVNGLWLTAFLVIRYLSEAGPGRPDSAPGAATTLWTWTVPLGLILFILAWCCFSVGRAAGRAELVDVEGEPVRQGPGGERNWS